MRSRGERRGGTHRRTSDKVADKLRAVVAMPEQVEPETIEDILDSTELMTRERFDEDRRHLEQLIFEQHGYKSHEIAQALRDGSLEETWLVLDWIALMSFERYV